ncbi:hypothetical protein JCM1840_007226 [Sporobolomyces johnsonii]
MGVTDLWPWIDSANCVKMRATKVAQSLSTKGEGRDEQVCDPDEMPVMQYSNTYIHALVAARHKESHSVPADDIFVWSADSDLVASMRSKDSRVMITPFSGHIHVVDHLALEGSRRWPFRSSDAQLHATCMAGNNYIPRGIKGVGWARLVGDRTLLDICEADWDDQTDADYQAALIKSEIIQQAIRQRSDILDGFTLERVRNTITATTGIAGHAIGKKKIVTEEQEEWANGPQERPTAKGMPGIQNLDLSFAGAGSREDDEEHDDEMAAPAEANSPIAGKVDKSVKDKHRPMYCYSAKDIKSSAAGDITLGAVRDAGRFQACSRREVKHAGSSDDEQDDDGSTLRSTRKSLKHRPRLTTVQVPANTAIRRLRIKVDPEPSALDRDGEVEMAGEPGGAANDKHRGDGPDWFDRHGAVNYVDRGLKTALDATLVQRQFKFHAFFVPAIKRALDATRQISPFHPSTLKVYSDNCNSLRDLFFAFKRVAVVVQEHDTGQAPPGLAGLNADRQARLEVEFNETWERMSDLEKAAFAQDDSRQQIAYTTLGSYGRALEELHTSFATTARCNKPVEITRLARRISARPLENTWSFVRDVDGPLGLLFQACRSLISSSTSRSCRSNGALSTLAAKPISPPSAPSCAELVVSQPPSHRRVRPPSRRTTLPPPNDHLLPMSVSALPEELIAHVVYEVYRSCAVLATTGELLAPDPLTVSQVLRPLTQVNKTWRRVTLPLVAHQRLQLPHTFEEIDRIASDDGLVNHVSSLNLNPLAFPSIHDLTERRYRHALEHLATKRPRRFVKLGIGVGPIKVLVDRACGRWVTALPDRAVLRILSPSLLSRIDT